MIKGERLTNLRLRLALWIFPLVKHYADIDMKVKCRELALEEAETICREVSWRYGSVWQKSAEECAYFIRNRIDNSEKFRDELLRRRDEH